MKFRRGQWICGKDGKKLPHGYPIRARVFRRAHDRGVICIQRHPSIGPGPLHHGRPYGLTGLVAEDCALWRAYSAPAHVLARRIAYGGKKGRAALRRAARESAARLRK